MRATTRQADRAADEDAEDRRVKRCIHAASGRPLSGDARLTASAPANGLGEAKPRKRMWLQSATAATAIVPGGRSRRDSPSRAE